MKIARVIDGVVIEAGEHTTLFPNTSFGGEPNFSFLYENQCLPVSDWLTYDPSFQRLASVPPYVRADVVYTVEVVALTQAELDNNTAAAIEAIKTRRAEAYREESDPLFFKSQRGEVSHQQWLDKVAEIKARYPG